MISREVAYQISFGATKAASKFVSHNPPPRSRPYPFAPTDGRLPLSSDSDCYDAFPGIVTQPEILFDEVNIAATLGFVLPRKKPRLRDIFFISYFFSIFNGSKDCYVMTWNEVRSGQSNISGFFSREIFLVCAQMR